MTPADENPSVLAVIIGGVVAACGFIGMWIWNHTMGRIRALEMGKVDRQTFIDYTVAAEISRRELRDSMEQGRKETRESIINLFRAIDDVKDLVREQKR